MAGIWGGLGSFGPAAEPIMRHLVEEGYLDQDGGLLFIGPEAERRFGYRHFMDLTAVFTAAPEFTVLAGRTEIGTTDPALLTEEVAGPRRLLLAGRSWQVTYTDWSRRRCYVEPVEGGGKARWGGLGTRSASYELTRAAREVLLAADPPVSLTRRAASMLSHLRDESSELVHPGAGQSSSAVAAIRTCGRGHGRATGRTPPWPLRSPVLPTPCSVRPTHTSDFART